MAVEPPNLPYEYRRLIAIAHVVENGKALETTLHFLVNGFNPTDETLARVAATGNISQHLKLLAKLSKSAPISEAVRERIRDWIKTADVGSKKRNEVVHTGYFIKIDGAESQIRRGDVKPINVLTFESLNATTSFLADVITEGAALTRLLVKEDCWAGWSAGEPDYS